MSLQLFRPSRVTTLLMFTLSAICFFYSANKTIEATEPSVGTIETAELSKLVLEHWNMVDKLKAEGKMPPKPNFILVDVRSPREMSVSVIPGAISKSEFEKNIEKYRGMTVIPYCTVGGRCADFSRQLAQSGWTVRSYRGSIVDWVKNELPLLTPLGEKTHRLHTNGKQFDLPGGYQQVAN
jgi:rhodanese-related sulfurtransferase